VSKKRDGRNVCGFLTIPEAARRRAAFFRPRLGLAGDLGPLAFLDGGVAGEGFFVLNENGADDARVVGAAKAQDGIGDDADFFVGVNEGEDGLGEGFVGQVLVGAVGAVFDDIGQEFELVNEVREQGFINLGELQFPLRQMPEHLFDNGWSYAGRPAIYEFRNFRHGRHCRTGWQKRKSE